MKTLVIRDTGTDGYYNMAADLCMMGLVGSSNAEVVFRTYTWTPHCLSIGRFQRLDREVDVERLLADGYHVVRRPTGGRAVWHGDELTYSIAARVNHPLVSGGINESLKKVGTIIADSLNAVGIPALLNTRKREMAGGTREHNPCFTSHGVSEIVTPDGRKLVGSAQARKGGVFLEHGSILFSNHQMLAAEYLPVSMNRDRRRRMRLLLQNSVGTVTEYAGELTRSGLEKVLHERFANAMGTRPAKYTSHDLPGLAEEIEERRRIIEDRKKA